MFFMALVSAYVVRKGFPNSDWRSLNVPRVLWLNTLILLASSVTLELSRHRRTRDDEDGFRHWWYVTTILGLFFVVGQIIAWRQLAAAGVYLATNPSSSFFYVFTGAHALHLVGEALADSSQIMWCGSPSGSRGPHPSKWQQRTGISWMGFGCSCFCCYYWGDNGLLECVASALYCEHGRYPTA